MPASVLVPFIVLVLVPVLVAGGVAVPVPVIMPVLEPPLVRRVMVVCVRPIMVVRAFGMVPISVQMVIMPAARRHAA